MINYIVVLTKPATIDGCLVETIGPFDTIDEAKAWGQKFPKLSGMIAANLSPLKDGKDA